MASCTVRWLKLSVLVCAKLTGLGLLVINTDITALSQGWTTFHPLDTAGMYFVSQSAIKKFSALSIPIYLSKLSGFQSKFSPILIHNIESMQITQLIVDKMKVRPFLRDAMYNVLKFLYYVNIIYKQTAL